MLHEDYTEQKQTSKYPIFGLILYRLKNIKNIYK